MLVAVAATAGAMVGSFCAAGSWRAARQLPITRPRSRCVTCRAVIPWWFNVPVAGWLMLRGRARCCQTPISVFYPVVECAVAVCWAVAAVLAPSLWLLTVAWVLSAAGTWTAAEWWQRRHHPG